MDVSLPGITQMSFGLTTALRYSLDMRGQPSCFVELAGKEFLLVVEVLSGVRLESPSFVLRQF